MMTVITMLSLTMSSMFIFMNHPLSMGLILLIQTASVSMMSGLMNYNYWYSYILFLILIGGMLILFMYMTSIASNEKFKPNLKIITMIPLAMSICWLMNNNLSEILINSETSSMLINNQMFISMNKFVNYPLNIVLMFLMIYLLMTMIATVKISSIKSGPLRQMFN